MEYEGVRRTFREEVEVLSNVTLELVVERGVRGLLSKAAEPTR